MGRFRGWTRPRLRRPPHVIDESSSADTGCLWQLVPDVKVKAASACADDAGRRNPHARRRFGRRRSSAPDSRWRTPTRRPPRRPVRPRPGTASRTSPRRPPRGRLHRSRQSAITCLPTDDGLAAVRARPSRLGRRRARRCLHRRHEGVARSQPRTRARIYRGQEDVTDDVMNLADLGYTIEGELAEVGLAPGEVHAVVVLAGRAAVTERVGPVRIVGEKDVLRHIASYGTRLTPSQVDSVLPAALDSSALRSTRQRRSVVTRPGASRAAPATTTRSRTQLLTDEEVQSTPARRDASQPDRGVDELPAPSAGSPRPPLLQRSRADPWRRGHGQDRRRPAPRRLPGKVPARSRSRDDLRTHPSGRPAAHLSSEWHRMPSTGSTSWVFTSWPAGFSTSAACESTRRQANR